MERGGGGGVGGRAAQPLAVAVRGMRRRAVRAGRALVRVYLALRAVRRGERAGGTRTARHVTTSGRGRSGGQGAGGGTPGAGRPSCQTARAPCRSGSARTRPLPAPPPASESRRGPAPVDQRRHPLAAALGVPAAPPHPSLHSHRPGAPLPSAIRAVCGRSRRRWRRPLWRRPCGAGELGLMLARHVRRRRLLARRLPPLSRKHACGRGHGGAQRREAEFDQYVDAEDAARRLLEDQLQQPQRNALRVRRAPSPARAAG